MTPQIAYPFQLTFQKAACCALLPQLTLHGVELQFQLTSRHILPLTEGEQSTFSSQSNTIQTLHNRLGRYHQFEQNNATLLPCYYRLLFLLVLISKDDLRPSLWDKTLPPRITTASWHSPPLHHYQKPLNRQGEEQVWATHALAYDQISMIPSTLCQSFSTVHPKARGQSLGCFCYQLHSE